MSEKFEVGEIALLVVSRHEHAGLYTGTECEVIGGLASRFWPKANAVVLSYQIRLHDGHDAFVQPQHLRKLPHPDTQLDSATQTPFWDRITAPKRRVLPASS